MFKGIPRHPLSVKELAGVPAWLMVYMAVVDRVKPWSWDVGCQQSLNTRARIASDDVRIKCLSVWKSGN
jgi:hypothetical protein